MTSDCTQAKRRILTQIDRWAEGRHHHPMSKRLLTFLKEHDLADHNGYFDWKSGGDGDFNVPDGRLFRVSRRESS
jgi:hypothetical protein